MKNNLIKSTIFAVNESASATDKSYKFRMVDSMGNSSILTVTKDRIRLNSESGTPYALSNVGYLITYNDLARYGYPQGGYDAITKIITNAVRDAYDKDSGDGKAILDALKRVTRISEWTMLKSTATESTTATTEYIDSSEHKYFTYRNPKTGQLTGTYSGYSYIDGEYLVWIDIGRKGRKHYSRSYIANGKPWVDKELSHSMIDAKRIFDKLPESVKSVSTLYATLTDAGYPHAEEYDDVSRRYVKMNDSEVN